MTTCPKISIVTPSYNQGQFIEQTIDSVLSQGYPNLEYFVFDGGSTDGTVDILKRHHKHLTYWESGSDRGQSHAINKGIQRASGEIFNWINSDDFAEPGALHQVAEAWMSAKSTPTAICGFANVWNLRTFSHRRKPSHLYASSEENIALFNINQEGTYFNLHEVKALGGLDERFHYAMDLELWLNLHLKFPPSRFIEIDSVLGNFRRHAETKSNQQKGLSIGTSNIVHEEMLVFDAFLELAALSLPKNADVLGLPQPFNYQIRQQNIQSMNWSKIQQLYVIKWAKRLLDQGEVPQVKLILNNLPPNSENSIKKDAAYLRRRTRFPFTLFN
jgi:hypothetical protein